jgi:tight adherence protein B
MSGVILTFTIFALIVIVLGVVPQILLARSNAREVAMARLKELVPMETEDSLPIKIVKEDKLSKNKLLDSGFKKLPHVSSLSLLLEQAGTKMNVGSFIILSLLIATLAGALSLPISRNILISIPIALISGAMPYICMLSMRKRRVTQFTLQFPEALSLMAGALRAGSPPTVAMKSVAQDMDDPIASEFGKAFQEQEFGEPLSKVLVNMSKRIPSADLQFFVTAVSIQLETGGSLAEIIDNLSKTIRERLKIRRQLKVLTAEARMSAWVLLLLPVIFCAVLSFVNPDLMGILFNRTIGHYLLLTSAALQVLGGLVIKKIMNVKM